jgi:hypothetical protein
VLRMRRGLQVRYVSGVVYHSLQCQDVTFIIVNRKRSVCWIAWRRSGCCLQAAVVNSFMCNAELLVDMHFKLCTAS